MCVRLSVPGMLTETVEQRLTCQWTMWCPDKPSQERQPFNDGSERRCCLLSWEQGVS